MCSKISVENQIQWRNEKKSGGLSKSKPPLLKNRTPGSANFVCGKVG